MNRHKKEMELCRKSIKLRNLKFDKRIDFQKAEEINNIQDEIYRKFMFYKNINNAIGRR